MFGAKISRNAGGLVALDKLRARCVARLTPGEPFTQPEIGHVCWAALRSTGNMLLGAAL